MWPKEAWGWAKWKTGRGCGLSCFPSPKAIPWLAVLTPLPANGSSLSRGAPHALSAEAPRARQTSGDPLHATRPARSPSDGHHQAQASGSPRPAPAHAGRQGSRRPHPGALPVLMRAHSRWQETTLRSWAARPRTGDTWARSTLCAGLCGAARDVNGIRGHCPSQASSTLASGRAQVSPAVSHCPLGPRRALGSTASRHGGPNKEVLRCRSPW